MASSRITAAVVLLSGLAEAVQAQAVVRDSARRPLSVSGAGTALSRPKKAVLLSVLLPGAGQMYNRKYWKLPLVYGALGGVGYGLYQYQTRYREYAVASRELSAGKTIPELSGKLVTQEKSARGVATGLDRYRTQRDTFIGYMALTYGMVALDALVDAHLREFDISEELALRIKPSVMPLATGGLATGLQLQLQVKSSASLPSTL
ncbi:DUF5683 domain-containing protein [Hymenobacter endophyticus]|uniref:DUF5683 domain-containing protein n=1 Tax=Hymenobacter endophyticus TaxID=3076335 RepID=A0ABU3TII3_9BACT|nr:DUF5683 domain-containing protein [Hymenobacter endophyticus]MDU0371178.1 DUF5683 domain-containing protein [Hymenobacter endophyticus]